MYNTKKIKSLFSLTLIILFSLTSYSTMAYSMRHGPFFTSQQTKTATSEPQPKLLVAIIVDQFRYDYLERFKDLFGKDGFVRLMNQGAFLPMPIIITFQPRPLLGMQLFLLDQFLPKMALLVINGSIGKVDN